MEDVIGIHADSMSSGWKSKGASAGPVEVRDLNGLAMRRWVDIVMRAATEGPDIRTISEWAELVAMSERRLRSACTRLQFSAKDSLDFARMLRLVIRRTVLDAHISLEVEDQRTVTRLLLKSGFLTLDGIRRDVTHTEYVRGQRFISCVRAQEAISVALSEHVAGDKTQ